MELEFQNLKLEELDKPAEFLAPLIVSALKWNLHPVFLFTGSMGAGKTTFTFRLVKRISPDANVNSPTYTLVNEYPIPFDINQSSSTQKSSTINHFSDKKSDSELRKVYHFDLHRLKSPVELEDLGFEEIWGKVGVSVIEWWQIAEEDLEILPLKIEVKFKIVSEYERNIIIKSTDIENFPTLKNLWKKSEGNPA
ncbi:hydrolase, P-loop-like family protein [Leptospira weilii serovar Ranarum str. ICFT]|uniref:tRNA threonylcarbamoyladenosine biosynthesis protein TsaE n=1 Tax=Leptospira weilii serovar Ranarum str. ICFT TaxID=1218598 RepID=N1WF02_9LEPT|nr:tRNA (adenosine(37)-N6)-threonylcarbamoyltransferase complex ATPase subunit type 1 TsaE [Leptospira weilii]EMY77520.1 hydrolase, P-loop-like family protein [Leptospira weilii serovar Ranarum str. ICFT]